MRMRAGRPGRASFPAHVDAAVESSPAQDQNLRDHHRGRFAISHCDKRVPLSAPSDVSGGVWPECVSIRNIDAGLVCRQLEHETGHHLGSQAFRIPIRADLEWNSDGDPYAGLLRAVSSDTEDHDSRGTFRERAVPLDAVYVPLDARLR